MAATKRDAWIKLHETVAAFPTRGFAIVDGGHFEDLPARFRRDRIFARSLFLDQVDFEIQKAGPWLVSLSQAPETAEQIFELVGARPAAVFWCCGAGEAILYRHLRTLNLARIPAWAAEAEEAQLDQTSRETYRTVFFRHFDPRVLGALLPILDAAQHSRVLGPAAEIAFVAEDYGGLKRVIANSALPDASTGILHVRPDQIVVLNERRVLSSNYRIAAYLQKVASDDLGNATEEEIFSHVEISRATGSQLGIVSEAAHSRWSLLMLLTKGRIWHHQDARYFIAHGDGTPDRRVKDLVTLTTNAMSENLRKSGRSR